MIEFVAPLGFFAVLLFSVWLLIRARVALKNSLATVAFRRDAILRASRVASDPHVTPAAILAAVRILELVHGDEARQQLSEMVHRSTGSHGAGGSHDLAVERIKAILHPHAEDIVRCIRDVAAIDFIENANFGSKVRRELGDCFEPADFFSRLDQHASAQTVAAPHQIRPVERTEIEKNFGAFEDRFSTELCTA